jgi:hypothetical protein
MCSPGAFQLLAGWEGHTLALLSSDAQSAAAIKFINNFVLGRTIEARVHAKSKSQSHNIPRDPQ